MWEHEGVEEYTSGGRREEGEHLGSGWGRGGVRRQPCAEQRSKPLSLGREQGRPAGSAHTATGFSQRESLTTCDSTGA